MNEHSNVRGTLSTVFRDCFANDTVEIAHYCSLINIRVSKLPARQRSEEVPGLYRSDCFRHYATRSQQYIVQPWTTFKCDVIIPEKLRLNIVHDQWQGSPKTVAFLHENWTRWCTIVIAQVLWKQSGDKSEAVRQRCWLNRHSPRIVVILS
jgi:hypothetical protein